MRASGLAFAVAIAATMLCGCDGDGKPGIIGNIDPETMPTMKTIDVVTFISDSGVVKYRITAPLWLVYDEAEQPHWRFPKGLNLERYSDGSVVEATVRADSAYYDKGAQLWRLDGNVRIANVVGEKFLTNQLFWDQRSRSVYSDSFIHIERADRTIEGHGFSANEDLTSYTIRRVQGIFPASDFRPGERDRNTAGPDSATKSSTPPSKQP